MEKTIELKLLDDGNIEILINTASVYTILKTSRQISADQIYSFMDPQIADKFEIKAFTRNEKFDKDNDVLKYFYDMLKAIVDSINGLNTEAESSLSETDEISETEINDEENSVVDL